jgi:tRNA-specific 2-thiouridylase
MHIAKASQVMAEFMISTLTQSHRHTNGMAILFDEPQKAVAPGQVAAVWDGDVCLGSGIISTTM